MLTLSLHLHHLLLLLLLHCLHSQYLPLQLYLHSKLIDLPTQRVLLKFRSVLCLRSALRDLLGHCLKLLHLPLRLHLLPSQPVSHLLSSTLLQKQLILLTLRPTVLFLRNLTRLLPLLRLLLPTPTH
jgi:hypothetical protein